MEPPVWTYVVLSLLGIIQILASVLVGILISRLHGMKADIKDFKQEISQLSKKLYGFVRALECDQRRKEIKDDLLILWDEFKNHKHIDGEVIR
ncbi:MAG: hypothetical protein JSW07_06895 [bacterium]|nr:MAG: hypothetical protein JSW07_06895 [bacterium]